MSAIASSNAYLAKLHAFDGSFKTLNLRILTKNEPHNKKLKN